MGVKEGAVVAHVAKYTRGAVGHMFKHYERAKDEKGEYIKFGNENIDTSRTHLNYNLAPNRDISQGEFVKQRCSEVQCLNRKDVNVMCSWVVTAPAELPKGREKEFFEQTYKFLENRYGEKNVVSAHVHMDEVTPHMHFAFVPVVYDPKKDMEKVSAKLKVCKSDLKTFHKDLESSLERYFGREVGILNQATKEGNKTILELKRESAAQLSSELENSIKALKGVKSTISELEHIEVKKSLIGGKLTLSERDFNKLLDTAKQGVYDSNEIYNLKRDIKSLKENIQSYKDGANKNSDIITELRKENLTLKKNLKSLKEQGKAMFETLKKHDLVPEAEHYLKNMRETEKQIPKVKVPTRGWDMER